MSNWSVNTSAPPEYWKFYWKGIPLSKARSFPFLALMLGDSKGLATEGRLMISGIGIKNIEAHIRHQSGYLLDWFYIT